jgi:hypothetical protein
MDIIYIKHRIYNKLSEEGFCYGRDFRDFREE